MAEVASRSINLVSGNYLKLAGEEWVRTLPFRQDWQRIRLGILFAVTPNGTSNIPDCPFYVGLCQGSKGAGRYDCKNFVGMSLTGSPTPGQNKSLTYNAGSGNPYYSIASGQCFAFQRYFAGGQYPPGPTDNLASAASLSPAFVPADTGNARRRSVYVIDITRTVGYGGAYTITTYGFTTSQTSLDCRPDHLMDAIDTAATPVINGQTLTAVTSTLQASEVYGLLDSLAVYWGRQDFPLEVYAVAARVHLSNPAYPYSLALIGQQGGADEPFQSYGSEAPLVSVLSSGTGYSGNWAINSLTTPYTAQVGYAGTTENCAYDTFESYAVGAVTSNVTINAGVAWTGNGFIY